jgi:hypothetical protein
LYTIRPPVHFGTSVAPSPSIVHAGCTVLVEDKEIIPMRDESALTTVPDPLLLELRETRLEIASFKEENARLRIELKNLKRRLVKGAVTRSQTRCSRVRVTQTRDGAKM